MFLDTETCVAVHYNDSLRLVDMRYGRANFRVVQDVHRPFVVAAAERKIVADRSNFDVRCEDGHVQVILTQGKAAIRLPEHAQSATLRSGDRLIVRDDIAIVDKPNLTPLLAWHSGQAVFENTPLLEAVKEMNRYSTDKLEVEDSRVASLRVSGAYRVGDNYAFAHAVAALLNIAVRNDSNQMVLIADAGVRKDHP
jgi:transmembrane sensor